MNSGGVQSSNPPLPSLPAGFTLRSVVAGDFNRDGKPDLAIVGDGLAGTIVLLGNGAGALTTGFQSPSTAPFGYSIISADFNQDGIPDVAIAGASADPLGQCGRGGAEACVPSVQVLLGDGSGSFVTGSTSFTVAVPSGGPNPATLPYALVAGDFNNDGTIDLAVTDLAINSVVILLGDGHGNFNLGATVPVGSSPYGVVAADFNHDGNLDLAVANTIDNTVTVLLGTGNGTFTASAGSPISVGSVPEAIAVVDFNGDGIPDLATANYADGVSGTVSFLLGHGDGAFVRQPDFAVGGGPVALAVGNFTDTYHGCRVGRGPGSGSRRSYRRRDHPAVPNHPDLSLGIAAFLGLRSDRDLHCHGDLGRWDTLGLGDLHGHDDQHHAGEQPAAQREWPGQRLAEHARCRGPYDPGLLQSDRPLRPEQRHGFLRGR
jgi:hypothetical protein